MVSDSSKASQNNNSNHMLLGRGAEETLSPISIKGGIQYAFRISARNNYIWFMVCRSSSVNFLVGLLHGLDRAAA